MPAARTSSKGGGDVDVARLRRETAAQQAGVEEQLQLVTFLRHAVEYKDTQIEKLQAELATINEASEAQLSSIESEKDAALEDAHSSLTLAELECKRLGGELHAYRALEPEVASLREQVDGLQAELGRERRRHEEQLARMSDDYQQYRQALQEQFSDMVHRSGMLDLSAQPDAESDSDAGSEASNPLQASQLQAAGNRVAQLEAELGAAVAAGEAAMARNAALEKEHHTLRLEHTVQGESLQEQTRKAVRYKKKLEAALAQIQRFEAAAEKSAAEAREREADEEATAALRQRERRASVGSAASSRSAGSRGSRGSSRRRPTSRAGSELSDYLEKRLARTQLEDEEGAGVLGMDTAAWAASAVSDGAPPDAAPSMNELWSTGPEAAGTPTTVRSESSLGSVGRPGTAGTGRRRPASGGSAGISFRKARFGGAGAPAPAPTRFLTVT